jgi:hypothetical protein
VFQSQERADKENKARSACYWRARKASLNLSTAGQLGDADVTEEELAVILEDEAHSITPAKDARMVFDILDPRGIGRLSMSVIRGCSTDSTPFTLELRVLQSGLGYIRDGVCTSSTYQEGFFTHDFTKCNCGWTLQQLHREIDQVLNISSSKYYVTFNGRELTAPLLTLGEYGIAGPNAVVGMVPRPRQGLTLKIFVRWQRIVLEIPGWNFDRSLGWLKMQLKQKTKLQVESQCLHMNGRLLQSHDHASFSYCGIEPFSMLELTRRSKPSKVYLEPKSDAILLHLPDGCMYELQLNAEGTLSWLQREVYSLVGIPACDQVVCVQGSQINQDIGADQLPLRAVGIQGGSHVWILAKGEFATKVWPGICSRISCLR